MESYLFFKWLHIVAIISWMAGILYLFRLLVNHREAGSANAQTHELLCKMERKLYRIITLPALKISYIAGFAMIYLQPSLARAGWFHAKFTAVLLLTAATIYAGRLVKKAAADTTQLPSSKALRWINEIPTILMLLIVAAVVFKPW